MWWENCKTWINWRMPTNGRSLSSNPTHGLLQRHEKVTVRLFIQFFSSQCKHLTFFKFLDTCHFFLTHIVHWLAGHASLTHHQMPHMTSWNVRCEVTLALNDDVTPSFCTKMSNECTHHCHHVHVLAHNQSFLVMKITQEGPKTGLLTVWPHWLLLSTKWWQKIQCHKINNENKTATEWWQIN